MRDLSNSERCISRFDELVNELSTALGPDAGLTTSGTDVDRLTELMARYLSTEREWEDYAFADPSRNYTRNLVDRGNGKSNLVRLASAE